MSMTGEFLEHLHCLSSILWLTQDLSVVIDDSVSCNNHLVVSHSLLVSLRLLARDEHGNVLALKGIWIALVNVAKGAHFKIDAKPTQQLFASR